MGGQLDSERMWTRAWLYHHLWSQSEKKSKLDGGEAGEGHNLRVQLETLLALPQMPAVSARRSEVEAKLAAVEADTRIRVFGTRWGDVRTRMSGEPTVRLWMERDQKRRYKPAQLRPDELRPGLHGPRATSSPQTSSLAGNARSGAH